MLTILHLPRTRRSDTLKNISKAKASGHEFVVPALVRAHPRWVELNEGGTGMPKAQSKASKLISLMWSLETREVRESFERLSELRKLEVRAVWSERAGRRRPWLTPLVASSPRSPARAPVPGLQVPASPAWRTFNDGRPSALHSQALPVGSRIVRSPAASFSVHRPSSRTLRPSSPSPATYR